MAMLKKLLDANAVRSVLNNRIISRLRRRSRFSSTGVVRNFASHAATVRPTKVSYDLLSGLPANAPSVHTRNQMDRWFTFLGVKVFNALLCDPLEMIVRPEHDQSLLPHASPSWSGADATDSHTAWSSPGSTYSDWYDENPKNGRLQAKRSKGILNVADPNYKAYPSHAKNHVLFAATCSFTLRPNPPTIVPYLTG